MYGVTQPNEVIRIKVKVGLMLILIIPLTGNDIPIKLEGDPLTLRIAF